MNFLCIFLRNNNKKRKIFLKNLDIVIHISWREKKNKTIQQIYDV